MKNKIIFLVIILIQLSISGIFAQDVTTVEALSKDISDNLDLEAVASIFGESEDLEDFERKLNDPDIQICNLDLNEDGEVDYLRVLETAEKNTHLITIQAVIGKDLYQDVATIDVEKDNSGETKVQVVGDVYLYGNDYIIEPVYIHHPVFFVYFWEAGYNLWYSPYYYNYYPTYYNPWRPYPIHRYQRFVHNYVNRDNRYNYAKSRRSKTSVVLHENLRRNDYEKRNPEKSFVKRTKGITNRFKLEETRKINGARDSKEMREFTGKKVRKDWTPNSSSLKEMDKIPRIDKKAKNDNNQIREKQIRKNREIQKNDTPARDRNKSQVRPSTRRPEIKNNEVERNSNPERTPKQNRVEQSNSRNSERTKKTDRN